MMAPAYATPLIVSPAMYPEVDVSPFSTSFVYLSFILVFLCDQISLPSQAWCSLAISSASPKMVCLYNDYENSFTCLCSIIFIFLILIACPDTIWFYFFLNTMPLLQLGFITNLLHNIAFYVAIRIDLFGHDLWKSIILVPFLGLLQSIFSVHQVATLFQCLWDFLHCRSKDRVAP